MLGIPFSQAMGSAQGASPGSPILYGGIRTDCRLLAVVKHNAAVGLVEGLDVSAFTVGAGSISSATVDTSGALVCACWTDAVPPA